MKLWRNKSGTVLITTLICLPVMVLLGGSAYLFASNNLSIVNRINKSLRAQSLAEAGLARALSNLSGNFIGTSNASYIASTALGGGTYSVAINNYSGRVLVKATGTYRGVSRAVSAEVTPPVASALDYAIASGGNATVDSGTANSPGSIQGSVYGAGNISLDGPSNGGSLSITGNVTGGGSVSATASVAVSGVKTPNSGTTVPFPSPTMSYYQTIASANGQYINANKTYNGSTAIPANPPGGVIYINGNLTLQGTQSTTACIVVTGNVTISKSGSTYPRITINQFAGYPAIIASGNINYSSSGNGGAYMTTTGLVYVGGNYSFSSGNHDSLTLTGSLVARGNFNISPQSFNSISITYASQNPPSFSAGSTGMQIVSFNG